MILITGATGKVGRHVVAGLLAEGVPARALTRGATAAGLPAAAAEDMLRYLAEYVGRTAQMSPDLEVITRGPATAFTDWAVEHAAGFR